MYSPDPATKRVEFRCPDPASNPYLAFAAMLMAGIEGILNRIDPGDPIDKNLYDLPPAELATVPWLLALSMRHSMRLRRTTGSYSKAMCSPPM